MAVCDSALRGPTRDAVRVGFRNKSALFVAFLHPARARSKSERRIV